MPNFVDMTGRKCGKLTVLKLASRAINGKHRWACVCDCGKKKIAKAESLQSGGTRSCGCLIGSYKKHGYAGKGHSEYSAWRDMLRRCYDKRANNYHLYGGRGISVHEAWHKDFLAFLSEVGDKPAKGMHLDRINNDGNYEPGNIRWATPKENQRNKRTCIFITINGVTKTAVEWEEFAGFHPKHKTVLTRFKRGWPEDKLLVKPGTYRHHSTKWELRARDAAGHFKGMRP